ncbi:MAG TPA: Ig-like domain-containing protein [Thermoanaerobaculia bacterium]|nr:Ig-like domain-containing protein [Thermoanaerobaculia bacterium]
MNRLKYALGLLAVLSLPFSAMAQQTQVPLGTSAAPYGYYEYLPFGYDDSLPEDWPVVIFLHGIGERGNGTTELSKVLNQGLPKNINNGTRYPFLVISPQSPTTAGSWSVANLDSLVQFIKSNYQVDEDRIFLTGLSYGGIGTWSYARNNPEELAAILPLCAAPSGTPSGASLVNVPVWAFHSWGDSQSGANPDYTVQWVNSVATALAGAPTDLMDNYPGTYTGPPGPGNTSDKDRTASFSAATATWTWRDGVSQVTGSQPTLTLYRDTAHDCWTRTYNNATPLKWLLAQTRHGALNKAPVVTITAPANNATIGQSSVTITAQVTDSDGTLGPVEFYAGSTLLGTDSSPSYQFVWNNAPAGTHWITVKATDDDGSTSAAVVRITVSVLPEEVILTPTAAGQAQGSLYYPMSFAFDGQPAGLDASGTPTGGVNGEDAPYYSNRVGYIDFGPDWQKVRISATWTKYRVSSVGNQTPYVELWWDDDVDTVNDSGLAETQVNFNSAQNLSTGSTEPWVRDRDLKASPVTPKARYLLCRSHSLMTNRAKEYAIVGWVVP